MMRGTLNLAMRTWIESNERGPQRASSTPDPDPDERLRHECKSCNERPLHSNRPSGVRTIVYTPALVGTVSGTVKGNDFAPTLSLGYGGTFAKGFTIGAELGVMFQGSPKIQNYQATGLLASNPAFQSDLQIERARVEDKVHSYQYWPIAQIELLYRF